MKKLLFAATLILTAHSAHAGHVNGYTRSNGTYVQGYERSAPDNTVQNNYSYRGNQNPYNGQPGDNSYRHDTTSGYYNGTQDSQGRYGHEDQSGNTYR